MLVCMRRHAAFGGSIAIHAVVGLALLAVRSPDKPERVAAARLELVEPQAVEVVELVELASSGGGGSQGKPAARSEPRPERIARADRPRARREIVRASHAERSLADSLADIATSSQEGFLDEKSGDGGDGGGRGGGHGRGVGRGVGSGLGDLANVGTRLPAPPAAPKASKARPPKLIYPTRDRPVSDGELFLARVTIDTDGYVVGARLLQGMGGHKDSDASAMIFRFRYSPALDDDGRPIKATVEQPFLVQ